MTDLFDGASVLITGASRSQGQTLRRHLLRSDLMALGCICDCEPQTQDRHVAMRVITNLLNGLSGGTDRGRINLAASKAALSERVIDQ